MTIIILVRMENCNFCLVAHILDTTVDFNDDSNNDLLYFYYGGRIAQYYYKAGEEILMFDIIEALSARFVNWENIEIDPLSLHDDTIQLSYWRGDTRSTVSKFCRYVITSVTAMR